MTPPSPRRFRFRAATDQRKTSSRRSPSPRSAIIREKYLLRRLFLQAIVVVVWVVIASELQRNDSRWVECHIFENLLHSNVKCLNANSLNYTIKASYCTRGFNLDSCRHLILNGLNVTQLKVKN